jgi:hypothetical protein
MSQNRVSWWPFMQHSPKLLVARQLQSNLGPSHTGIHFYNVPAWGTPLYETHIVPFEQMIETLSNLLAQDGWICNTTLAPPVPFDPSYTDATLEPWAAASINLTIVYSPIAAAHRLQMVDR